MADSKISFVLGGTKGKLIRFSYLHVHEPKLNKESGNVEFSVALLIPKTNTEDVAAIRKAIKELQQATWLNDGKKLPPKFWNPLRDGDTEVKQDGTDYGDEYKGHFFVNAKANEDYPPEVVSTRRDPATGKFERLGKRDIKSGDWGRAKVTMYAYTKGTGGVGVGLSSVQLVKQGEPLGSQSSAENDFAEFEDDEDDDADMLK